VSNQKNANDFLFNPHFLHGGAVTDLSQKATSYPQACTGPVNPGGDQLQGRVGLFITATILPVGHYHRFRVDEGTDPKRACFNFTSEATNLIGAINPPFYPERPFNQGNVGRIFVFAGSAGAYPACFNPPAFRPIRGCPTADGWIIQVDSGGTGNYDMTIFYFD
jgi:hypothetical protein